MAEKTAEEMMEGVMSGEVTQEEYNTFLESSINDTEPSKPTSETVDGDSLGSEETEDKEPEQTAEPEKDADPDKTEVEEEPVVLAKDGKHTIPFSVVEELRDTLKATREQNQQLADMLKDNANFAKELQQAQAKDEEAGDTEATDNLLGELEEDYPGITESVNALIKPMQDKLAEFESKEADKVKAEEQLTAAQQEQSEFEKAVTELNADYPTVSQSDKFWAWFDKAPSYIKAVRTSGDPQAVADVISLYQSEQKPAKQSGDTPAEVDKEAVEKKVADAIEKADKKSTVNSLSDIPGATNSPQHDEMNAIADMDSFSMANKFLGKNQTDVENLLNRLL